jgi:hypothetical protein
MKDGVTETIDFMEIERNRLSRIDVYNIFTLTRLSNDVPDKSMRFGKFVQAEIAFDHSGISATAVQTAQW